MTDEKVVYIIPGFKHLPTQKAYTSIAQMLAYEGYHPILMSIPWGKATISENTKYFLKEYKKSKAKKKYILGFSFGAMIALLAATKVRPSGVILCSLSPYFKEDFVKANKTVLHSATLAKKIKTKQILMLYGKKEERTLIKRVTKTYDQIISTRKSLISIDETEHNIGDRRYLRTIHQVARELY